MRYVCEVRGRVYDSAKGAVELDFPPGTTFDDPPDDFQCPDGGKGEEYLSSATA